MDTLRSSLIMIGALEHRRIVDTRGWLLCCSHCRYIFASTIRRGLTRKGGKLIVDSTQSSILDGKYLIAHM